MLIFLDTEFTGLTHRHAKLLSIALVPEDGQNSFYAELLQGNGWEYADCSDFVREHVLPIMLGGDFVVPLDELRNRLYAWFEGMPKGAMVACDSVIDFRFLKSLLNRGWPQNLADKWFDTYAVNNHVFDAKVQSHYNSERPMHNALFDAQAYRLGWLAVMDWRKTGDQR